MLEGEAFFVYDEFRRIPLGMDIRLRLAMPDACPERKLEEMIAQK